MNNFHILMIIFSCLFSLISSTPERKISYSNNDDLDATKCNYGKHHKGILRWCDCKNVLGNGSHCEIVNPFNRTHIQLILVIVPDHLDSWKKNMETQFPKEIIKIVEETKYYAKGFVDNNIYFQIQFLPNISDKKYFLMPRSNFEMREEILSKKNNNADVSNKEKMNKDDHNRNYIIWTLVAVILAFVLLGLIKIFLEDIKKIIFRPIINRLRSNTDEHGLLDLSGNRNAEVTLGSNIENEEQKVGEEQGLSDFSGNPNAEVSERSDQTLFDVRKNNENEDIQCTQSFYFLNHDF